MKILVLNCGSSSIKYQLIDMDRRRVMARGIVAKIGEKRSYIRHRTEEGEIFEEMPIRNHVRGLEIVISYLLDKKIGVIRDRSEISAVGHRVVHGGSIFLKPTLITDEVIKVLREYSYLAPLHNPHNLAGIEAARKIFPGVPQVAVFDTSFHQTIPERAYLYPIPYEFYLKYGVRKYGFHGISCQYVSTRCSEILGKPLNELRLIICHLGNGVTICAVDGGKSIDTSMGLTPLGGVMMGTRCGDLDPGVIFYLLRETGIEAEELNRILNNRSGLLGISGVSNDIREILSRAEKGDVRCRLAIDMFTYRIKKWIGAYAAALGGFDALIFTAGIGENSPHIRSMVCEGLDFMGVELDEEKNAKAIGTEAVISKNSSRVKILVIPTDEEKLIAYETMKIVKGLMRKEY